VMVNDVYVLDRYPQLRTAIREMREAAEDCVVVSALPGDFLSPCTLTSLDGGVGMLAALNEADIQYVTFGNHEFDLDSEGLQERIREYKGTWLNSNVESPAFVGHGGQPLPRYDVIRVGSRKVALAGFCLDDMSQYSPVGQPTIRPINEAMADVWEAIKEAHGGPVDVFLPMTHQNIKEDRKTAEFLSRHELGSRTPVLLASHDHEVYIEQVAGSLVFKVGCDIQNIGVVDIWWTGEGHLRRSAHLIDCCEFDPDHQVQNFVSRQLGTLDQMLSVQLFELPEDGRKWSSEKVRFKEEPLVSELLRLVKRGMEGVDLVMLQGGGVRGAWDYQPGPFTYGDLMREFAFETPMAIVELPGHLIEESVRASRLGTDARPFFLHLDADAVGTGEGEAWVLSEVDGEAFDRARTYRVATYQFLLNGMGSIQPLYSYVQERSLCPALDSCLPIKHFVIDASMRTAWRELLGCWNGASNGHSPGRSPQGTPSQAVRRCLRAKFEAIDEDHDGYIDASELATFLDARGRGGCQQLVKFLIQSLDQNSDGRVDLKEILALAR